MNDGILGEVSDDGANADVPTAARVSAAAVLLGRGILYIFWLLFVCNGATFVKSNLNSAILFFCKALLFDWIRAERMLSFG